ncbi:hypothetical protein HYQ44_017397 [Verticillium longisporum]|nr:hypothetical protein HYQ44_017397 [Verticillium longisporum]
MEINLSPHHQLQERAQRLVLTLAVPRFAARVERRTPIDRHMGITPGAWTPAFRQHATFWEPGGWLSVLLIFQSSRRHQHKWPPKDTTFDPSDLDLQS